MMPTVFPLLAAGGLLLLSLTAPAQTPLPPRSALLPAPPTVQQALSSRIVDGASTLPGYLPPDSARHPHRINRIICVQSLRTTNLPLYILNGKPQLNSFKPEDVPAKYIKKVKVLTGTSATAIAGARAANGLVLITTKRRYKPAKS